MAALISLAILVLLLVVPISQQINVTEGDLLPSDAVCSHLCQNPEPTTDVYLTNGQKKHLEECQDFILALEETPKMLEVFSDLQGMEMVHLTGEQSRKLITGYNGYYRQKSDLPLIDTGQELPLELPAYNNETLESVQEEFLKRWNAYVELEQSLRGINVHWDNSKSTEEEQEESDKEKDKSNDKMTTDTEDRILSRKKRLGKSYRPSKSLRELIRERISLGLDLSLKSNGVFNPRLHTNKRQGLPNNKVNDSALPEDGLSESFKQRFMRRYHAAIANSLQKIKTGTRVGSNSVRQKRQTKEETFVELCPTVKFWTAMVLGYDENGSLVQITQFPEYGQQQWFQEEKCLYILSPVQGNVECKIRFREVPAMVVDLNVPDGPVQESFIKVESCAAYLTTGDTLPDTPPDSETTIEPPQEQTTTV